MKKTYSIFIIALVLYLSVINCTTAYAQVLGNSFYNSIPVEKAVNEVYLNSIQCKSLYNQDDNVLEVFSHNTQKLYITEADIQLMAKLVYAESIGEPYEGKVAVASVVLNRTINPKFPNTIKDVILQKNAFSCVKNGDIKATPNQACYDAVYDAIKGADPTNEALFFYNPSTATCAWMHQTEKQDMTTIGHHTFFKIKS
ncbi:cell wall hydrolase [Clostridium uliginosum]|uniref:N-acetylmuramoyl-L-alanine amidase n=1 Tax=Clostridium uliginosum TaxID=119641 RepID=A0A1I1MBL6_9CLOT|nr:cell wall hydrolase [Clostridium uliginosum]SFC82791.1 N-acetylmuramoyl-L-alanine amidase [Clostridium uliginosum]